MNILEKIINKIKIIILLIKVKCFSKRIKIGKRFCYREKIKLNCADKGRIEIGNDVFFNVNCSLNAHQYIKIGDDCIFGENVKIYDHNHKFNNKNKKIREQGFSCKDVKIGNNCWIGSNVTILAGTEIGNNSVIGANSVISGKIEDDVIVYLERKYIFEQIKYKK